MRKFLILLTALILCGTVNVKAQDDAQTTTQFKRFEHNFYAGAGVFIDRESYYWQSVYASSPSYYENIDKGLSYKFGYGLNYYFTELFSLMGGVAYRREVISPFVAMDGGSLDSFGFIDVPVVFQVHLKDSERPNDKWMLGLGVVFSPCIDRDEYYFGDDPTQKDPLEGKAIIKNFYINLMPCVAYETKHFRYGLEFNIGLHDVNKKYAGLNTSKKYLSNTCAVVAFKF